MGQAASRDAVERTEVSYPCQESKHDSTVFQPVAQWLYGYAIISLSCSLTNYYKFLFTISIKNWKLIL
jgi:hypothetical protein